MKLLIENGWVVFAMYQFVIEVQCTLVREQREDFSFVAMSVRLFASYQ